MKKYACELTALARMDFMQIWEFLADARSLEVADKILNDIESGFTFLSQNPRAGHRRSDLSNQKLLFYRVHSYFLIYRLTADTTVIIVRIIHAARDVRRILSN